MQPIKSRRSHTTMGAAVACTATLAVALAGTPAQASPATDPSAPAAGTARTLDAKRAASAATDGYWTWRNVKSGLCMGTLNGATTNGTPVIQWDCNGNADQLWSVTPVNVAMPFELHNAANPSKCLGVTGGSLEMGASLLVWDCNSNIDQLWFVQESYDQNGYVITNAGSYLVAAVLNGSTERGAQLIQWEWNKALDQRWW